MQIVIHVIILFNFRYRKSSPKDVNLLLLPVCQYKIFNTKKRILNFDSIIVLALRYKHKHKTLYYTCMNDSRIYINI